MAYTETPLSQLKSPTLTDFKNIIASITDYNQNAVQALNSKQPVL